MESIMVAIMVVCVWTGAQIVAAVPYHDTVTIPGLAVDTVTVPELAVEKEAPPSARFVNVTIIRSTITKNVFETVTVNTTRNPTCIETSTASGVTACSAARSLGLMNLPIDASRPAQPDIMFSTSLNSVYQESANEVLQLLLPSYIEEESFPSKGRFINWISELKTEEKISTLTLMNTILNLESTVTSSLTYSTGCIPTDAPQPYACL